MNKLISYIAIAVISISGTVFARASVSHVEQLSTSQERLLVKKCLQKLQTSLDLKKISEESIKEVVDQVVYDQANEGAPEFEDNKMKKIIIVLISAVLLCSAGYLIYRCADRRNPGQIMIDAARQEMRRCQLSGIRGPQAAQRVFNAGVNAVGGNNQAQIRAAFSYPPRNVTGVLTGFYRIRDSHTGNNFRFNIFESAHQVQDYYRAMFS